MGFSLPEKTGPIATTPGGANIDEAPPTGRNDHYPVEPTFMRQNDGPNAAKLGDHTHFGREVLHTGVDSEFGYFLDCTTASSEKATASLFRVTK